MAYGVTTTLDNSMWSQNVFPTAQMVDLDFYKDVVAMAKRHEMWVLSDLAYADTYFDENRPPPSILQIDGAKDIAIEFAFDVNA